MKQTKTGHNLIIHGHFYQPPRENPWTGRIDHQKSAAPYHDWNERITRECYLPNTCSRRLDEYGRIIKLLNNYEWISFNFGPTLLSWLEEKHPGVYSRILDADRASSARFGGHGNAIAQVYNHIIMPLASRRDQETQIRWGVRDFEKRFGRAPEGIWLAETAINDTTLEILIASGFRFTILSPHQAKAVRTIGGGKKWNDVSDGTIPTGAPYRCFAPGRKGKRNKDRWIDVFFYDADLSTDISFNHLLRNGDKFAETIMAAYPRTGGDLVTIATDGEIYGHHEPFADMALSYLIDKAAGRQGIKMTNCAAYLSGHDVKREVRLKPGPNGEGTAWSCSHGVGRWKENCGCSIGSGKGWTQEWRKPLRAGLDALRNVLAQLFEKEAGLFFTDPWKVRDDYIGLILERTTRETERFIADMSCKPLSTGERTRALQLLESQRNALLMYTSCGWFFDDISGIETEQIMKYAGRSVELAGRPHEIGPEKFLLKHLKTAKSNIPGRGTGLDMYRTAEKESRIDLRTVVALHVIFLHLFGEEESSNVFMYEFSRIDDASRGTVTNSLRTGAVEATSCLTLESYKYQYPLIIENNARLRCFVKPITGADDLVEAKAAFTAIDPDTDIAAAVKLASHYFADHEVPLDGLFREDSERIYEVLCERQLDLLEDYYVNLFELNKDLLHLLNTANIAAHPGLLLPAQVLLAKRLVRELEKWERSLEPGRFGGIQRVIDDAAHYGVPIDKTLAADPIGDLIFEQTCLLEKRLDAGAIDALLKFIELSDRLGIDIPQHEIQNGIFTILESAVKPWLERAGIKGRKTAVMRSAVERFLSLAERFNFNVDSLKEQLSSL